MEDCFVFLWILLLILIVYFIIQIPITIAKSRGIQGSELSTISILSWVALFFGITWFVALFLSLIYQPQKWIDKSKSFERSETPPTENIEKLLKLNELREKNIITQDEFKSQKDKLLKSI